MSAFRFYTDREGLICGGTAIVGALSSETWKLTACPVKSLEECGVEIHWPGAMWTHDHIAQVLPNVNTERAA